MRPAGGHNWGTEGGGPTRGSPSTEDVGSSFSSQQDPAESHKPGSACKAEPSRVQDRLHYARSMGPT